MGSQPLTNEDIALRYLEQLPWPPYPFQEQAIFSWFESEDGILVCAPTGTGKTVIAETALYHALMTGRRAYYTTPLIALSEQKYRELRESAVRWGFSEDSIGLVTGNRRENVKAPILVVVAEILLNRLLDQEEERFEDVSAVVMDEFHSFNDPERGIVWELSLGMLPRHCRLLLISATVGNATDFVVWLARDHGRRLRLLQSQERRVPLDFRWVTDEFLPDHLQQMTSGDEGSRYTPALVFCFNRNECWSVAEQMRGKDLLAAGQQRLILEELDRHDWSVGAGGKLRQFLLRGIGLHHAGLLPRYRRVVESLFQKKLLSLCICTETLAAGINLPARSVVMTSLLKGPYGAMKLIDASSAHQIFGRAGRPQYDDRGYVFAVAHEDDVRLHKWQEKYDQIPENTKDPMLIRAKKNLKKKMPKRREGMQYWSERQFLSLRDAPPGRLASRGRFPWRLLAWLIRRTGAVQTVLDAIRQRLLDAEAKEESMREVTRMLMTLEAGGFLTLEPPPPRRNLVSAGAADEIMFRSRAAELATLELLHAIETHAGNAQTRWLSSSLPLLTDAEAERLAESSSAEEAGAAADFGEGLFGEAAEFSESAESGHAVSAEESGGTAVSGEVSGEESGAALVSGVEPEVVAESVSGGGLLGRLIQEARTGGRAGTGDRAKALKPVKRELTVVPVWDDYQPRLAIATPLLPLVNCFRSINPLYGLFLAEHMHRASHEERLLLLESVLDMPTSVANLVRVPLPDSMPAGPLASEYLNPRLLSRGLLTVQELTGYFDEVERRRVYPLPLGDRMRLLFQNEFPGVQDVHQRSVWCVGDLLRFGGNFDRFVRARDLLRQEGVVFRHCLRMILLLGEFAEIEPPQLDPVEWRRDLAELASLLTDSCRAVDPSSTDEVLTTLRGHAAGLDTAF